jgi:hypothetical protein
MSQKERLTDNILTFRVGTSPRHVNCIHVFGNTCVHCRKEITDSVCVVLGDPYHAHLHKFCLPRFDFSEHYPHREAMTTYFARSDEEESKLAESQRRPSSQCVPTPGNLNSIFYEEDSYHTAAHSL